MAILILILFAVAGLILAYASGTSLKLAFLSTRWPTVEGTIIESTVREKPRLTRNSLHKFQYFTQISYKYTVNEQPYEGDTLYFGETGSTTQDQKLKYTEKYPTGHNMAVAYNPTQPSVSVLEPGVTLEALWLPAEI